jgi:acetyl esterase
MPLHPQAQQFVDNLAAQGAPGWHELSPDEGRKIFASLIEFCGRQAEVARVEDLTTPGGVALRVYTPTGDGPHPALVYFHGGGWVLGDLDTHDRLCRQLADESSCVVVAVDYRRAPEHKYPCALIDSFEATQFVAENSGRLGILRDRVAVGGDSAGGSLALGVSRLALDKHGPEIRFQLLIYPVVGPNFETSSYQEFADGHGLTRDTMKWFWEQYLGDGPSEMAEYVAPSPASELQGLPPAHIMTAEFDVLRDEGEDLAAQLRNAEVPATLHRYDGMLHGFVHFSGLFDIGVQGVSDAARILKERLAVSD